MSGDPFFFLIVIAVLAVAVVLILGLGNFAAGNKDQGERSNKLMRWRVGLQFVAVVLIAIYVYARVGTQ